MLVYSTQQRQRTEPKFKYFELLSKFLKTPPTSLTAVYLSTVLWLGLSKMTTKAKATPVKERMKVFQNTPSSTSPPSPTSHSRTVSSSSAPTVTHGVEGTIRNKEESAPRERRAESRHHTGPVLSQTKDSSAQPSQKYSKDSLSPISSTNQGLLTSFRLSAGQTNWTSLDGTSQTRTNSEGVTSFESQPHSTSALQKGVASAPNLSKVKSDVHGRSTDIQLHSPPPADVEGGVAITKVGGGETTNEAPPPGSKLLRLNRMRKCTSQVWGFV